MDSFEDSFSPARAPSSLTCTIGAIGAGVFGVGWLILLAILGSRSTAPSVEMLRVACYAIGFGGTILWFTWLGLAGSRHGGAWPMIGAAGGPLAMIMMALPWRSGESEVNAMCGFLVLFALGHLFAKGVSSWVRGFSFAALCLVTGTAMVHDSDSTATLAVLALASTGVAIAVEFAAMARRAKREPIEQL